MEQKFAAQRDVVVKNGDDEDELKPSVPAWVVFALGAMSALIFCLFVIVLVLYGNIQRLEDKIEAKSAETQSVMRIWEKMCD